VNDPKRVQKNPFFPFIVFEKKFNQFGDTTPRKARGKIRKLRYASRKDVYIYEFYRQQLAERYEEKLAKRGLAEVVIAYRRLKTPEGRGKCRIEFAKDAFSDIVNREYCIALVVDISSYFESLKHRTFKCKHSLRPRRRLRILLVYRDRKCLRWRGTVRRWCVRSWRANGLEL
jgi:hypothetical protein